MRHINSFFLTLISAVLVFASCTGKDKNANPDSIYFDYRVSGDEDAGYITVRLQYKIAGPGGASLLLQEPSKVELDGANLKADSSKMNGPYYEITRPVKEFAGQHTITFTDRNGKQYTEEFSFRPISLATSLPTAIKRDNLSVDLEGLDSVDYVKVMLTDTASFSEGIERVDTVKGGHITITKDALKNLANGHIVFELTREEEKRIKNGTRTGGKLVLSYELRREFELKD